MVCRCMIDSENTITSDAGVCDTVEIKTLMKQPYLENTDYPT
jgi:hypothetical protein